jgi:exopolysaccharide biosynthesis polyprenyl glycosylphosphotransferase
MFHWLTMRLCGYVGGIVLAIGSLLATATIFQVDKHWLLEAAAAIMLVRYLRHVIAKSSSVLAVHLLQGKVHKILIEEIQFSIAFLAACFVMEWPIASRIVAVFLLTNTVVQVGLMALSRPIAGWIFSRKRSGGRPAFSRTALVVGTGPKGTKVADAIQNSPELDAQVVGFLDYHRRGLWRFHDIPLVGHPDQLERLIIAEQIDALFIALDSSDIAHSDQLFRTAEKMGVVVYVLPDMYNPEIARSSMVHLNGFPALVYQTAPRGTVSITLKSLVDKIGAAIGFILSAPIWIVTIIAIKMDSRGPIFFRQIRSGLNGRRFELYKFRTMSVDAELKKRELRSRNEMSGPVFKIRNDPRLTGIGRFLRKYSIDELPQLVNILKGDMSLVGPRPPIPEEVSKYQPWQRRKLSVKPGLTCLWQVNGRNAIGFEDWMKLDLEYIDNWSLALDAKIIARTVPAVLKGSGL